MPTQALKKHIKIRIIIRIRRIKSHRKNEDENKERKKHQMIKTPVTEKEKQGYL